MPTSLQAPLRRKCRRRRPPVRLPLSRLPFGVSAPAQPMRYPANQFRRRNRSLGQAILDDASSGFIGGWRLDTVDRSTRSRMMAGVRSTGNRSTEWRLRGALVGAGVRGWTIRSRDLVGTPDFVFRHRKVAIFVDGCFWHGCPEKRLPTTRRPFWREKIEMNKRRDRRVDRSLRTDGWRVVRIWEHDLRHGGVVAVAKIRTAILRETGSHAGKFRANRVSPTRSRRQVAVLPPPSRVSR